MLTGWRAGTVHLRICLLGVVNHGWGVMTHARVVVVKNIKNVVCISDV